MILLTYGTRPEYIKIKPLISEMTKRSIPFKTLFTGQHVDIAPKDAGFILTMKDFGPNRLDNIIQNCMNIDDICFEGVDYMLVQGDTTSVVGLSMAALHRRIKLIHLEAGLRTYDTSNPYPEENNRMIVSTIADFHLCPTENNRQNLLKENVSDSKIFVVGNTVLDNLVSFKDMVSYDNKILITLHRRENHHWIDQWFKEINDLASQYTDYEFILPLHPNPNIQKYRDILTNVKVINPLTHTELIELLISTKLVITDSGGLQEECSFFNKNCLVCRKVTERPESLGLTSWLIDSPELLKERFIWFLDHFNNEITGVSPYGDGKSAEKICDILAKF